MSHRVRLHVNVDHVATLRQARGTTYPDPAEAAVVCEAAGAHGITIHLREDRRHINDADVVRVRLVAKTIVNLEMAATQEMVRIAIANKPHLVTLVPEKREERTTEGGLDVVGNADMLAQIVKQLDQAGILVSMFIDPEPAQIDASLRIGARAIELHTGDYANAETPAERAHELQRLAHGARHAATHGNKLTIAAGHGLTRANVGALLRAVPEIVELNVGHAIVADAVVEGMTGAVRAFLFAMQSASNAEAL